MRRIRQEIKGHPLSATLFALYWLAVFGLHVFRWNAPPNRPEDMVRPVFELHLLLPVIAGALVAGWRRPQRGAIGGGMLAGAVVLILDAAAVVTHQLLAFHHGKPDGSGESILEVPVFLIALGLFGSLLGLFGALAGRAARRAGAAAGERPAETARGTMAPRMLKVAGGLALVAAAGVFLGVIPGLATDPIIRVGSPKAVPAFAVNAMLNALLGILLLVPVSWRSAGAGKVLVVIAGFFGLLLGFALLDAASALGVRRFSAAAACLTAAAADLGAGLLALITAMRRTSKEGTVYAAHCRP